MTVAWPVGSDRIIAASDLGGQFQLLDPSSGRALSVERAGIGSWRPDARATSPPAASAYVIRDENTLVRLDLGSGKEYAAGTIDGSGWLGCGNVAKYLVCRQPSRLVVTAVG
jgi:hypothetical protein